MEMILHEVIEEAMSLSFFSRGIRVPAVDMFDKDDELVVKAEVLGIH
jgi:HSP20 family molecular chaperone IbpA